MGAVPVGGLKSLLVGWTLGLVKFRRTSVVGGPGSSHSILRITTHVYESDQSQEA